MLVFISPFLFYLVHIAAYEPVFATVEVRLLDPPEAYPEVYLLGQSTS